MTNLSVILLYFAGHVFQLQYAPDIPFFGYDLEANKRFPIWSVATNDEG